MKEFEIEITETLQKQIKILANSEKEAYEKILFKYRNGEIVLDSSDFVGNEVIVISCK